MQKKKKEITSQILIFIMSQAIYMYTQYLNDL